MATVDFAVIDRLQRSGIKPQDLGPDIPQTRALPEQRRLLRINGVGRTEKSPASFVAAPQPQMKLLSEDMLVGMHGQTVPLAYLIQGTPAGAVISLGIWSPTAVSSQSIDASRNITQNMLQSLYPAIDLWDYGAPVNLPTPWPRAGFVLGIPTPKPATPGDNALPVDKLIRAMAGASWAALVLAQPVPETATRDQRNLLISEMKSVETETQASRIPSPLAEYYLQLLQFELSTLTLGQAFGAWRTAVYLLGTQDSYDRLTGVWRSVFTGDEAVLEPLRVWKAPYAAQLAVDWAMPEPAPSQESGRFHHIFQHQTLLTSLQLAAYVHLPQLEAPGFAIHAVPDFDVVPAPIAPSEKVVQLGKIVHRTFVTQTDYSVRIEKLNCHTFVVGVTGSGKTNTIFHLLKQTAALQLPFLVIEPAKTEYRALLNDPDLGSKLQIFTPGDERLSPLRLNPFEIVGWPSNSVSVHLDLLRSVFSASFGMWTPLPQILEQCLHRIYQDRGWDIVQNTCARIDSKASVEAAYPTLSDLIVKVDQVTQELGYASEFTANARAALRTRLGSLRSGGKGCMLDVQRSFPMEELLQRPTILELEGMGDDDDKAFMIGLLLIRLVEYRRAQGQQDGLQHLLVVEEAHRLLANVEQQGRQEESNPRGKAVETFANLLSEIRAYGQGVMVADQVPVKLAPDVIKNTNLKIVHRIVAADDRVAMAGAMAMNEQQTQALATLGRGQAAVFAEGEDAPLLVQVPPAKGAERLPVPSLTQIADQRQRMLGQGGLDAVFSSYSTCQLYCKPQNPRCIEARRIAENPVLQEVFAAFVLSLALAPSAQLPAWVSTLYPWVHQALQPLILGTGEDPAMTRCALTHGLYDHLNRRGARYGWNYQDIDSIVELLLPSLLETAAGQALSPAATQQLAQFRDAYLRQCKHPGPFYGCNKACGGFCFHRYAVEGHVHDPTNRDNFRRAIGTPDEQKTMSLLCNSMTERIFVGDVDAEYRQQAERCFVIQQAAAWPDYGQLKLRALVDSYL